MPARPLSDYFGGVELLVFHSPIGGVELAFKWLTFWGVGIRLAIAGLRQLAQPGFTANQIFELKGDEANPIVRELGSANFCLGFLGILSLPFPEWRLPAAAAGGLFYGLVGILHIFARKKSFNEYVALYSDLAMFVTLGALLWIHLKA